LAQSASAVESQMDIQSEIRKDGSVQIVGDQARIDRPGASPTASSVAVPEPVGPRPARSQEAKTARTPNKSGRNRSPLATVASPGSPANVLATPSKDRSAGKNAQRDTAVVLQLTKTKMCAFFERGKCASTTCKYAHSADEIRKPPNLQKTKLCKAFLQGNCQQGENCFFAHGEGDLRVTEGIYKTQICNFYEHGYCKKGERCNHAHGAADLRPARGLAKNSTPLKAAINANAEKAAFQQHQEQQQQRQQQHIQQQQHPMLRSPLPLAELLVDSEVRVPSYCGQQQHHMEATPTKSVASDLASSLAFSPPARASPLCGGTPYAMHHFMSTPEPLAAAGYHHRWPTVVAEPLDVRFDPQGSPQRGSPALAHVVEHPSTPFKVGLGTRSSPSTSASASAYYADLYGGATAGSTGTLACSPFAQDEPAKLDFTNFAPLSERLASLDSLVKELSNDVAAIGGRPGEEKKPLIHKI